MQYVICQTEERGMFKVTCPVREVGKFAKVSIKSASRILGALTDKGMLNRYSRGTHSANGTGKASIYGLMDLMMGKVGGPLLPRASPLCEYEVDESAGSAPPGRPHTPLTTSLPITPFFPLTSIPLPPPATRRVRRVNRRRSQRGKRVKT
jgi:hypothetical protein